MKPAKLICGTIASLKRWRLDYMSTSDQAASTGRHEWFILAFLVILAALLRFCCLDQQSLWLDELWSWEITRRGLAEVFSNVRSDVHPPLYFVLLMFVQKYVGTSEIILRLPSAIFGTIAVVLAFCVGKRLYSASEGLVAATFTALISTPIYYSQEARAYSLLLCTALWTTYHLIDLLEDTMRAAPWKIRDVVGYVVAALVAAYSHYFGLLQVVLQGCLVLGVMIRYRYFSFRALGTALVLVLSYVPWLPSFFAQLRHGAVHIPKPTLKIVSSFVAFSFGSSALIVSLGLCFAGLALYAGRRKDWAWFRLDAKTLFLLYWVLAPFLVAFIQSWILEPVLNSRNMIIGTPALYLLVARMVTRIPIHQRLRNAAAVVVPALLVGQLVFVDRYYDKTTKTQFREAVREMCRIDRTLERSMIVGYSWGTYTFDYYFSRYAPEKRISILAGKQDDLPRIKTLAQENQVRYIWYVNGHRVPDPKLLEGLNATYRLVSHEVFLSAEVRLYEISSQN